jgi:hypothetical protein
VPFVARTDADLAGVDVLEALRDGLGTTGAAHRHLFGDAAIAAALAADRLAVAPRSMTFLAEIVRRGGVGYAADVEVALPTPEQSALARSWLAAVRALPSVDEACASWLEAVAKILHVRQRHRLATTSRQPFATTSGK